MPLWYALCLCRIGIERIGCFLADAGFLNTTVNILNRWFYQFFPRALELGLQLDALGGPQKMRFTAQSWIVSLFLDCPPNIPGLPCPSAAEVANFTQAVQKGGCLRWTGCSIL